MRLILIIMLWAGAVQVVGPAELPVTIYEHVSAALVALPGPIRLDPYWLACPALVTGYSPYDAGDAAYVLTKGADRWKTARGVDVRHTPYGLAVDPRALPYNTQVIVPGYRSVSAPNRPYRPDDTGGRLRQNWQQQQLIHVDVRFATNYSATRWGVRYQLVWVLVDPDSAFETKMLAYNQRHKWLIDRKVPASAR